MKKSINTTNNIDNNPSTNNEDAKVKKQVSQENLKIKQSNKNSNKKISEANNEISKVFFVCR